MNCEKLRKYIPNKYIDGYMNNIDDSKMNFHIFNILFFRLYVDYTNIGICDMYNQFEILNLISKLEMFNKEKYDVDGVLNYFDNLYNDNILLKLDDPMLGRTVLDIIKVSIKEFNEIIDTLEELEARYVNIHQST